MNQRTIHAKYRTTTAWLIRAILVSAGLFALPTLRVAAGEPANRLKNGDFEQVVNDKPSGWKVAGNVQSKRVSGIWRRLTCKFNSRNQDAVMFSFDVPKGSFGSVWIDNLALYKAPPNGRAALPEGIRNASFEEISDDESLTEWQQNNRNITIFSDPARASDGERSVRITHINDAAPMSQFTQIVPVERDRQYEISFDLFVGDDFQGEANGLIFDEVGNSCIMANHGDTSASLLTGVRDRCDRYVAGFAPKTGAAAEISQEVAVEPGMNLQASMDVNNPAFQGGVCLMIEDAVSGEVLNRSEVRTAQAKWQDLRLSFESRSSKLRVRVRADGEGELQVDNVSVECPRVSPPIQKVSWLPSNENFALPSQLGVFVQGASGKVIDGGLQLLGNDLKKYGIELEKAEPDGAALRLLIGEKYAVEGRGPEAYALAVNKREMTIKAGQEAGAFYGLMTLLQLIERREGKPVVLACEATDYPDMPMRGILYGDPEQAARLKMNTLMLSTGYPDTPARKQDLHVVVQKCRTLNLQVIPYFLSLFGGYYAQSKNPNLAAGIWVKDEQLTLRGDKPSSLRNRYVIRTGLTDVELKSLDGKKAYVLGKDYRVISGDMAYNYDKQNAKPFAVARVPGSSIPDGAVVLANYNYVSHYRDSTKRTEEHIAYCPVEPEAQELMSEYMTNLAKDYSFDYINPSDCLEEFRPAESHLETDIRCIKSGKRPIELLAADVCLLDKAAKAGNPKARMLQWVGTVNNNCKTAGPKFPKDALINIWGYDANWPAAYGVEAVECWTKLGFETSVMPWDNLRNVRGFAQVVAEARRKGYPCVGMIGSSWDKRDGGFKETAIVSWRIPKEGEKGFVALSEVGDVKAKKKD